MPLPDMINRLPNWSLNESNRWADYIELSCLNNPDHIFALDDLLSHYYEEKSEEFERGSDSHSAKYDKLVRYFERYFEQIRFRSTSLGDNYPFELEMGGRSLTLKVGLNERHMFYLFLLFASHPGIFKDNSYALTHAFEDLSCSILKTISPGIAVTQVFGTSRSEVDKLEYKGNLKERLSTLAANICAVTSKSFDADSQFNVPAGDGGIDLVSYVRLDNAPFIPLAFGQCACSYDKWVEKQTSIAYDRMMKRFNNIAHFLQFTFVPFYWRLANEEFESLTDIYTCLIDRHRILIIMALTDSTTLNEFMAHSIYNVVMSLTS